MEIRAPQADMPEGITLFEQEVIPRVQARLGQKPSLAADS
jgi:hypothetical protein